ncbi:MAG: hypothetical protein ABL933_05085 [Methyloglobulus sp.]|nr:hypothetical protein [Methyloglobulus sp.]
MSINYCFAFIGGYFKHLNWLLLSVLISLIWAGEAVAFTLDVKVIGGVGGHVASDQGIKECFSNCTLHTTPGTFVNLLAIPDKGYRFLSWQDACANTTGSLCTLRSVDNAKLSARFAKIDKPQPQTKVLLLLHDEGERHWVWNEFVAQYFDNQCPTIYGGVVLGEDSANSHNHVHCYRIKFGYYRLLNLGQQNTYDNNIVQVNELASTEQLADEVKAAVIGILNRHNNLNLMLIGHEGAAIVAESFLTSNIAKSSAIIGLLKLKSTGQDNLYTDLNSTPTSFDDTTVFKLNAGPQQVGKISAALAQMDDFWWLSRW